MGSHVVRPRYPTFPGGRGITARTPPIFPSTTGDMKLPQYSVWSPAPVSGQMPGVVEGPNQGSGEGTVGVSPAPQPGQTPTPDQQGIMSRLKDPRLAGLLISMGSALGAPPTMGQTGWGKAAQAMGQGYNYLAMANELQRKRDEDAWNRNRQVQQDAMQQEVARGGLAAQKAGTENSAKQTQIATDTLEATKQQHKDELALRRSELENNSAKTDAQLSIERDRLEASTAEANARLTEMQRQHMDDSSIKRQELKLKEAQIKLDANLEAAKLGSLRASANAANANAAESVSRIPVNQAQAATIGAQLKGELTPEKVASIAATTAKDVYGDPLNYGKPPEELAAEVARRVHAATGMGNEFSKKGKPGTPAPQGSGPDPNLPDGTRVKGPDGNIYVMKGGKPVPEGQQVTPAPAKSAPFIPTPEVPPANFKSNKKVKIFPNE